MWIIFALITTIIGSFESILLKRNTLRFNSYIITWSLLVVSSIIYLPILLAIIHLEGFPKLTPTFWIALVLRILFDSFATVLYIKALQLAEVSLVVPMTAFAPIFVIFTSFFINRLFPSPLGIVGILLVLVGIYYLNFNYDTRHVLSPFQAAWKEKGILIMLLSVFLTSIVTSLKRLGIDSSSPYFYVTFAQILWTICFMPVAYFFSRKQFHSVFSKKSISFLFPVGVLDATQVFTYNIAIKLTIPAYVVAVRGTGILFTSVFAWIFFKEKLREKVLPILIVIAGIVIISVTNR